MKKSNLSLSSCFSFELLFEDNPLTGPSAHVILRSCSKDEDGTTTYLTPDCVTPEELHHQVDRLQSELESIRNRGIRAFIESINADKRKRKKK
jgi:hypothetical protein